MMRRFSKPVRIAIYLAGAVVLVVAAFFLQLFHAAGQFKTLEPHFAGSCTVVPGIPGAEDITIHPRTGVAYITSADRRSILAGGHGRGAIYAYDLKVDSPQLQNLTPAADEDFHPHGLSLYPGDDGRDVLYVVNHAGGRHTIEVYDLVGTELSKRATLSDPLLVSPNDLVAVGRDLLYVTNDHANAPGFARQLEDYLQRSISTVVYYDGERFVEAASGIRYPNGVNVSGDGKTLYVASTTGGSVFVFQIDSESAALEERGAIEIGSGVDNIEVDREGDLWIGAHPKLLTFVQHTGDASRIAPSQVIRIGAPDSNAPMVEEVLLSLGEDLSGSSVAAVRGDRLLVGSVMDDGILDCRIGP
jgi:arylesterase/paraoxonase